MKKTLLIMKDASNDNFYCADFDGKEAHQLAFEGSLIDAIRECLNLWGLSEDDINIIASN